MVDSFLAQYYFLESLKNQMGRGVIMATTDKKYVSNVPGKIYVDSACIDCDLCRAEVPEVFTRHNEGYSYVFQQPQNPEILERTLDVVSNCPVEAIGGDGEDNSEAFA